MEKSKGLKLLRLKQIIKESDNINVAVKQMITEHLIMTHSEGRRLYHQIREFL